MDHQFIFTTKLQTGNRTYFFDLKTSKDGDRYLKIIESKRKGDVEFERYQIIVFDEGIHKFAQKLTEVVEIMRTDRNSTSQGKKHLYPMANQPWTPEDDNRLELLFCEGRKPAELAKIFGRKDGAIRSRIKKLELKEKYPN